MRKLLQKKPTTRVRKRSLPKTKRPKRPNDAAHLVLEIRRGTKPRQTKHLVNGSRKASVRKLPVSARPSRRSAKGVQESRQARPDNAHVELTGVKRCD